MAAMKLAGTEKRRSTEQKNTVTMGVTATQDSTSEWRELGAQVMFHMTDGPLDKRDISDWWRQPQLIDSAMSYIGFRQHCAGHSIRPRQR